MITYYEVIYVALTTICCCWCLCQDEEGIQNQQQYQDTPPAYHEIATDTNESQTVTEPPT